MSEGAARPGDRLALAAVLLAAAALRFAGLTHHLARGGPEYDERTIFVEPVLRMWRTGSLDPTVYTGYAGFFNHLVAIPVVLGLRLGAEAGAAAAARGVVAAFGVLSVVLAYALARRYAGHAAGLLAAALLAVSPLEVRSAHYVTPDVLVGTAMLGALLVLARGRDGRAAATAGALLGAATAIKYTGLVLAPAVVVDRLTRNRGRGLGRATLAAAATFAACAPFALLQMRRQGAELTWAVQSYYGRDAAANRFAQGDVSAAAAPLLIVAGALGPVGCALALGSIVLFRDRRVLLPLWAAVVGATVALVPANLIFPRHLVPVAAVTPVIAAAGWRGVADLLSGRRARGVILFVLALAALAPPAGASARLVARYLRTPAVDRAAEWIEGHLKAPARVAVSLDRFALDPARFEIRTVLSLQGLDPAVASHFDAVVATRREAAGWRTGFATLATFESEEPDAGRSLVVLRPSRGDAALSPSAPVRLRASHDEAGAGAAWDEDPETVWRAPAGAGWMEARWAEAIEVARIEIETGPAADSWPQDLSLLASADGHASQEVAVFSLRPNRPSKQRVGAPHGQVYVLTPPLRLLALRIERRAGGPWSLATLRVFATTGTSRSSPSPAGN
jgi:4-amino-4-deoxy-L-arabinose transferase-like glycosyltransferase